MLNSQTEISGSNPNTAELINEQLKQHQIVADWKEKKIVQDLHLWTERFRVEFKLKIDEIPAISIDRLGCSTFGHFKPGRNGFGLRNEVAINETYIKEREYWQTLGTLLHELLHVEEEIAGTAGKNNYHNKAFRERALSLGLIVDKWGHMKYATAPSPFWSTLGKFGILPSEIVETGCSSTPPSLLPGKSKLKLWICDCKLRPVHVRVAIADFSAMCLRCGAIFRIAN